MKYKITFIGSGNVAWNLAHALDMDGHMILRVLSRNADHAKELASKFGSYHGIIDNQSLSDSDIVFVSINDDAYDEVISNLNIPPQVMVCHTSGPIPLEVLEPYAQDVGVFYPLQSLNKNRIKDFRDVPLLIEASNASTEKKLYALADRISNKVSITSSESRMKYHLAAVFANNFTNLMYSLAQDYLESNNLEFDLLKPIIYETALKLRDDLPKNLQTGPAKRNDLKVLEKHKAMLKDGLQLEVYEHLSQILMTLQ
ncbi:MAG: DUF2520 domain-containing protein [Bacteroidia bacterium]